MASRRAWEAGVVILGILVSACAAHERTAPRPVPVTATAPTARAEVVVRAQEPEEAFEWLWRQLGDMAFFRANHYDVALPSHPLFQSLARDGLGGADADKEAARGVFVGEVYDARAFDAGKTAFEARVPELAPELDAFARWSSRWGFVASRRYEVVLTLYGPGGSYDSDRSRITVLTSPDARFRKEPLHNLVHEMVHLGVERPIVQRFALSHPEKERLVDRICVVAFGDRLPGYEVQAMGPPELDAFIDAPALDDLPAALRRYQAQARPRPR